MWKTAFKKFKDCLPQILLGPLLNISTQMCKSKVKLGIDLSFVNTPVILNHEKKEIFFQHMNDISRGEFRVP